jgi:hypothetical protein
MHLTSMINRVFPKQKRRTMKRPFTLLTALLLAPLAVEILAAENLPTDHLVEMRAQGRDPQQRGLEKLWDYGDIAKEALDAEVVSSRIQDGYKIDAVYINGAGGGEKGKDRIFCYYARPL